MDWNNTPVALHPILRREPGGVIVACQHDPGWPRGLVVLLWLLALVCVAAARWGTDETGAPPWVGYAVGAGFALGALLVPRLAPAGYELRLDPRARRWRHVRRSLGQTRQREGGFDALEAVELRRIETLDDGGGTTVSFVLRLLVRGQQPLPFFETRQSEEARLEAARLAGELGLALRDHAAVDAA